MAEPIRTTQFGLRLLELSALLFPVILFLVQTAFRLVGEEREREVGRLFKWGLALVVLSLLFLYTASLNVIDQLERTLTGGPYAEIINTAGAMYTVLFFGTLFLTVDAYLEGIARIPDESDETTNTVQAELPIEDSEDE